MRTVIGNTEIIIRPRYTQKPESCTHPHDGLSGWRLELATRHGKTVITCGECGSTLTPPPLYRTSREAARARKASR